MKEDNDTKEKDNTKDILHTMKKSRIIYLNDPIDKESAYKTNRSLLVFDEINNEPIKIFINSPGGEVNSGFFIFDCIKFVRSPVYVIGAGLVASAAALIYLAVEKEYRLSLPHARYLLHQPMSGSRGVVSDLEIHAKEVEDLKRLINNIIAEATDNPLKQVEADTDRDFWLNPSEAKAYGMVGTIITSKDDFKEIFPLPEEDKKKPGKKPEKKSGNKPTGTTTGTKKTGKKTGSVKQNDTKKTPEKTPEKTLAKPPTKKSSGTPKTKK